MKQEYAVVTAQEGFLYAGPGDPQGRNDGEMTDAALSGWALRLLKEDEGWACVRTFYGYEGWIRKTDIRMTGRQELEERQDKQRFRRICARSADLLSEPKVQGSILETLLQDSVVEFIRRSEESSSEKQQGWSLVRSAAGVKGWLFTSALDERRDDDGFLLQDDPSWFTDRAAFVLAAEDEEAIRERAVQSAKSYFGCAYRWGGKSPQGIDCSGLVFMSWMEQGILIYRDAHIDERFPVRVIPREEVKKGDLIFFPGHVAMSLGGSRYIHATGAPASPRVRINSLDEADPDYRADLAENVTMCGSVFPGK